jgi:hypothetical protein
MIQHTFSMHTSKIVAAQIWQLMADVDNWKTWDDTVEKSKLNGPFEAGSTFLLRPKGGPNVNIKLVDVQPQKYFKDETRFPLAKMHGEHWYEETSKGLKITVTMTMRGPLSFLWNKLVMKGIVGGLEQDIKNQVEAAKNIKLIETTCAIG